jgi:hypothetical protein
MAATQTSLFARHQLLPKGFDHKVPDIMALRSCHHVYDLAENTRAIRLLSAE